MSELKFEVLLRSLRQLLLANPSSHMRVENISSRRVCRLDISTVGYWLEDHSQINEADSVFDMTLAAFVQLVEEHKYALIKANREDRQYA